MIPTKLILINLDRSTDRLASFRERNAFLTGIERFAAIEGRMLDRERLQAAGLLDSQVSYTDGALGCALSHFTLWERAATDGTAVTICEDDAVFNRGFERRAAALLGTLPDDWDIVLWGWNFDSILLVDALPGAGPGPSVIQSDQTTLRAQLEQFQALDIEPRALRLLRAFGMVCYSLTPGGAARLLHACRPIRPMTVPVPGLTGPVPNYGHDVMCNAAYPQLKAYVAFPPLVVSPNDHSTSLVQTR